MYLAAILSGFPFSSSNSFTKTCDFGFPHLRPGIRLSYLKQYWLIKYLHDYTQNAAALSTFARGT